MTFLQINLLGPFEATIGGEPAAGFDSDKVRALLSYLAAEGDRPHRREALAGLFWPEQSERSARANLRRALTNLRKVIGDSQASPPFLEISRQSIRFNLASDHQLDLATFTRLTATRLTAGSDGKRATIEELEEAVALYRGAFLEGFSLAGCVAFEEWQLLNRETLQRMAVDALARLVAGYEQLGLFSQALPHARHWLALEPWDEEGHRQVMRLLALSGRRSEALAQYEICRQLLTTELGVEPDEETEALAGRIRSGQLEREYGQIADKAVRGYELRERLGAGTFGVVYRAYQPAVKRDVAIKIIRPELANQPDFIRRFDVEAQLAARLEHPNIVPLYDYWRDPDGAYLVMRWLKGGSLAEALKRGSWSVSAAAGVLDQIGAALHAAHRRGVIHRDIRPANILLDEEGNAYLSDFGVATLAEAVHLSGLSSIVTDTGAISGSPEYISPEQLRQEPLTTAADVYCLGILLYVLLTGKHPFSGTPEDQLPDRHLRDPLPSVRAVRPELPKAIDAVIQTATAKDPEQRYADALSLAAAFSQASKLQASHVAPAAGVAAAVENPYKGLRPFQESDAGDFFGREELVARLLDRLKAQDSSPGEAATGRLLAVVGPSGSGKSSAVKAGLMPALRKGAIPPGARPGSDQWYIVEMAPGSHPYEALEGALLRIATHSPAGLRRQMREDERGILRAVQRMLPETDSQLLLIVDQFEELFTLVEDRVEREAFLDGLCAAVNDARSRLQLVITLRADYYDRPLQHRQLGELIRINTEIVLPLAREELEQAISGPAARVGLALEPGLVQRIQEDIQQEPGALPLLQYALTEMVELHQELGLTWVAYEAIGGVAGAIAQRAEALFANLDASGQEASRQLFLHLVTPGKEPGETSPTTSPAADTRRRVLRAELESLTGWGGRKKSDLDQWRAEGHLPAIIDAYGAARLLTFDRDRQTRAPTVEIAHEALLAEWPRLKGWIEASREDLRQQQRLQAAADEWHDAGQDPGFLLQGARLERAAEWSEVTEMGLTPLEIKFIETSLAEGQRQHSEEETRQAKERSLERRARNLRIALIAAAVVALLAVACGVLVLTGNLAAGVGQALSSALESPGRLINRQAPSTGNMDYVIPQGRGVAFNPQGGEIATSGQDAIAVVREASGGEALFELRGHRDRINNIAYSLDGNRLATTSLDGTVKVWDAHSGEALLTVEGPDAELVSPALSPDGSLVAATTFNSEWRRLTAHVWDTATGEEILTVGFGDQVGGLAFSPDGTMLAVPGTVGKVTLWEMASGKQLFMLREDNATVIDVAFSPDGQRLATANSDGTARVWDLASRELLITMRGHDGWVTGVDFSPDGRLLGTAGQDGTVRVYEVDGGQERHVFHGHEREVLNVSFSPDGWRLASGSDDDRTIVWNISR